MFSRRISKDLLFMWAFHPAMASFFCQSQPPPEMELQTLGSGAEPRVTEGDEHQEHFLQIVINP